MSKTIGKKYPKKKCVKCKKIFTLNELTEHPVNDKKEAKELGVKIGDYVCWDCLIKDVIDVVQAGIEEEIKNIKSIQFRNGKTVKFTGRVGAGRPRKK